MTQTLVYPNLNVPGPCMSRMSQSCPHQQDWHLQGRSPVWVLYGWRVGGSMGESWERWWVALTHFCTPQPCLSPHGAASAPETHWSIGGRHDCFTPHFLCASPECYSQDASLEGRLPFTAKSCLSAQNLDPRSTQALRAMETCPRLEYCTLIVKKNLCFMTWIQSL